VLIIPALFLASVVLGFAINRFAVSRIGSPVARAIALALSRAVFYAPSIIHIGHGAHLPYPLLLALVSSFDQFGVELDVLVFALPVAVFGGSLLFSWWRASMVSRGASDA
jgi:hypothetical protein